MCEYEGEMGTDDYEVEGRTQNSSVNVNALHWDDDKKRQYAEKRCFNCKRIGHFTRQSNAARQHRSQFHLNE